MPDSSQTPAATALLNLDHEIKTASEERLRALLLSICNEIPEAHKKAVKELFVDSSIVKNVPGQIAGTKRPVSRYERCGNCKEEFDVTENSKTSCRYHPGGFSTYLFICGLFSMDQVHSTDIFSGYAFPDEELFADHDEPLEILDSDDYRKSYPENFIFDCCDGNLMDDIGCEVDWHRSLETADISKRTRLDMLKEYDDQSSSEYESE
ncbi:hypothetical protein N7526_000604 [Penicillium atrosanguineum]|nr:hypothetical protein N7526_000604 [Penicillium atrosanguineum]